MPTNEENTNERSEQVTIGTGYANSHLALALITEAQHPDSEVRTRAKLRVADWLKTLRGIVDGTLAVGSRTPVQGIPGWATLKVLGGGFATGELLAEGPLQPHELALLERFPSVPHADARRFLNTYYLSEEGFSELQELLRSGAYEVNVPEEGALLVVAWLAANEQTEQAQELLEILSPWFPRLRFYPISTDYIRPSGSLVSLRNVEETIQSLKRVRPKERFLAQKEAVCVWTPLYDRIVTLFLETVEGETPHLQTDVEGRWSRSEDGRFPVAGGWPCQHYPQGWTARATALLQEYENLRLKNHRCSRPDSAADYFAQLREFLYRCLQDPELLSGREVGRIRQILACFITKRGIPGSEQHIAERQVQFQHANAPTHAEIARVIIPRLQSFPPLKGVDDIAPIVIPVSVEETEKISLPAGTPIPVSLQEKVEYCLRETVDVLVERGLITSGETLARLLPQMTSGIRSAGIADPTLRRLYATIYTAFRRRRSLLLLDLQKQVQIEELPWVAAIDSFRREGLQAKELARQTLEEVSLLTLVSFPQVILPNKLLQELRAVTKTAGLNLPIIEEVAADIFMGEFSSKFLEAAQQAGALLEGSLYATYYEIDYGQILGMKVPEPAKTSLSTYFPRKISSEFSALCASRAGIDFRLGYPATNGMIIEQQQILTTQNLAVLFAGLGLVDSLRERLEELPRDCFRWICRRLQVKADKWHALLIQVKNAAYAWRQMVFYLALLPPEQVALFLSWAKEYLTEQSESFQVRFRPALVGLELAARGQSLNSEAAQRAGAHRFLGWSKERHWLLADQGTQR